MPLAVMLHSALEQLDPSRTLAAYVIDDGISEDDKRRVEASLGARASLQWLPPVRSGFDRLPLWGRMPITTYDKLMVAEALPAGIDKVIWLDCDMLILGDLARLWDMPTRGKHALAVEDSLVPRVSSRFGVAGHAELQLDPRSPYFNAGLMVIDTALWRRDRIAQRSLEYLEKYRSKVFFWDQEALNAVLAGCWSSIDSRWNHSANLERLATTQSNGNGELPWIVHFNGNLKPWVVPDAGTFDTLYFQSLDETAWKGWRPPRTARTRVLGWYGSSRLRRVLYPLEQLGIQVMWRFTKR